MCALFFSPLLFCEQQTLLIWSPISIGGWVVGETSADQKTIFSSVWPQLLKSHTSSRRNLKNSSKTILYVYNSTLYMGKVPNKRTTREMNSKHHISKRFQKFWQKNIRLKWQLFHSALNCLTFLPFLSQSTFTLPSKERSSTSPRTTNQYSEILKKIQEFLINCDHLWSQPVNAIAMLGLE